MGRMLRSAENFQSGLLITEKEITYATSEKLSVRDHGFIWCLENALPCEKNNNYH